MTDMHGFVGVGLGEFEHDQFSAFFSAAEVFAAGKDSATSTSLLWPYLLAAALLVFLLDVGLKRVEMG
jgi:hypothetical protein